MDPEGDNEEHKKQYKEYAAFAGKDICGGENQDSYVNRIINFINKGSRYKLCIPHYENAGFFVSVLVGVKTEKEKILF